MKLRAIFFFFLPYFFNTNHTTSFKTKFQLGQILNPVTGKKTSLPKDSSRPPKGLTSPGGFERRSIMKPTRSQLMKTADHRKRLEELSNMSINKSNSRPDVRTYTKLYTKNSSFQGNRRVSSSSIQLTREQDRQEPPKRRSLSKVTRNSVPRSEVESDVPYDGKRYSSSVKQHYVNKMAYLFCLLPSESF